MINSAVAVRNGMALEAALDHGLENIKEITAHKVFDQVRFHPDFTALLDE